MDGGDVSPQAHVKNEVWLEFADGRYLFKLKLLQLAELQEKCKAGVGSIYMRVTLGEYYASDLFETIRLGLIGGARAEVAEEEIKVTDIVARRLIERYCSDKPLDELHQLASAILGACVVGYKPPEDKKPGKDQPSPEVDETAGSTSHLHTQMELPLEGSAPET